MTKNSLNRVAHIPFVFSISMEKSACYKTSRNRARNKKRKPVYSLVFWSVHWNGSWSQEIYVISHMFWDVFNLSFSLLAPEKNVHTQTLRVLYRFHRSGIHRFNGVSYIKIHTILSAVAIEQSTCHAIIINASTPCALAFATFLPWFSNRKPMHFYC